MFWLIVSDLRNLHIKGTLEPTVSGIILVDTLLYDIVIYSMLSLRNGALFTVISELIGSTAETYTY